MIRGFRDKKTEQLFAGEPVREFSGFAKIAERKLTMLDNASEVRDLLSPPGNRLVIFPRFCGHRVTRQPPLLRTRRGTDSQGSSGVAADYKILRGIQRFPAWRPPATDTGGDGLIPASTCQRSSRHTRCPSSFLDVTCFRSCLQPAVVAGRPWLHTDSHDPNGGAGL